MPQLKKRYSLIKARKEKGYTQQELAKKVGISRAFLANIESGKHDPSLRVAWDIASALEKTVEELFFEKNVRFTHMKKTTA